MIIKAVYFTANFFIHILFINIDRERQKHMDRTKINCGQTMNNIVLLFTKNSQRNFQKTIDKLIIICYNSIVIKRDYRNKNQF